MALPSADRPRRGAADEIAEVVAFLATDKASFIVVSVVMPREDVKIG